MISLQVSSRNAKFVKERKYYDFLQIAQRRPELSGTSCLQGTAISPSLSAAEKVLGYKAAETTAPPVVLPAQLPSQSSELAGISISLLFDKASYPICRGCPYVYCPAILTQFLARATTFGALRVRVVNVWCLCFLDA